MGPQMLLTMREITAEAPCGSPHKRSERSVINARCNRVEPQRHEVAIMKIGAASLGANLFPPRVSRTSIYSATLLAAGMGPS